MKPLKMADKNEQYLAALQSFISYRRNISEYWFLSYCGIMELCQWITQRLAACTVTIHYPGHCRFSVSWALRNKCQWNYENITFSQTNSNNKRPRALQYIVYKMSPILILNKYVFHGLLWHFQIRNDFFLILGNHSPWGTMVESVYVKGWKHDMDK